MFGFLNLFLATAFLKVGMKEAHAAELLEERSAAAFQIDEGGIGWKTHWISLDALRAARNLGMVSFGSCSFEEPIGDLEALDLLEPGVEQA
jgi:hypothetical protein